MSVMAAAMLPHPVGRVAAARVADQRRRTVGSVQLTRRPLTAVLLQSRAGAHAAVGIDHHLAARERVLGLGVGKADAGEVDLRPGRPPGRAGPAMAPAGNLPASRQSPSACTRSRARSCWGNSAPARSRSRPSGRSRWGGRASPPRADHEAGRAAGHVVEAAAHAADRLEALARLDLDEERKGIAVRSSRTRHSRRSRPASRRRTRSSR